MIQRLNQNSSHSRESALRPVEFTGMRLLTNIARPSKGAAAFNVVEERFQNKEIE